jgi:hypothetical protein
MWLERFIRPTATSTEVVCLAVAAGAALMWLATVADHVLGLGWGLEAEGIWTTPLIGVVALLVRILARVIFRWIGAVD